MARTPLTPFMMPPLDDEDDLAIVEPPAAPWHALVGNASPAEAPGQTAEQYAQAAQLERKNGNVDTAARLTVKATEAKAAENAAQGTPAPTTPLAPVSPSSSVAQADTGKLPAAQGEHGTSQYPWSWAVARQGTPAPEAAGDIRAMDRPELYKPLEEPPAYEPPNAGVSFFALALDALLNRGRNAGRLVGQLAEGDDKYINYSRKVKAAKDAADIEATKRRGSANPFDEYYKNKRLELAERSADARDKQIDAQAASAEARAEKQAYDLDPNHEIAQRVRANLYAQGVQPGSLDGLSLDAMKSGSNAALKNMVEQAQSTEMAAVAAEKAQATAEATEDSKVRVADRTSAATFDDRLALTEAAAGVRAGERQEAAALTEEQAINAERRKRLLAQNRERTTLESLLARVEAQEASKPLPKQGHVIERGIVQFKADLLGGTGMSPDDSMLDNDLTMAGLQNYITGAGNAPNSLPEQEVAGRKFRGDGTYGGAAAALRARLAEMDKAEGSLREQEDATRVHPPRKSKRRRPARPAAAPETTYTPPAEADDSALDGL